MKLDAVLWDYDGTLVNSVPKNIDITKQILLEVAPRLTGNGLPACLQSEAAYHIANHRAKNWQELYVEYYGMTPNEMKAAGKLWTEFQLKNTTPVVLFPEIEHTVSQIMLPQGICSQNSAQNIYHVLRQENLHHKFQAVVGYDDIPSNAQKPNPYSGVRCLEQLLDTVEGKTILYVGDHEGDVEFARNMERELHQKCRVIAVGVKYSGADMQQWHHRPDFEIDRPTDLLSIVDRYS